MAEKKNVDRTGFYCAALLVVGIVSFIWRQYRHWSSSNDKPTIDDKQNSIDDTINSMDDTVNSITINGKPQL